ncbi:hypothetical protein K2Q00_01100 [Patescibacteria group bacterium]|nr:hypothetical protein [Patescibacteria group bacterium]
MFTYTLSIDGQLIGVESATDLVGALQKTARESNFAGLTVEQRNTGYQYTVRYRVSATPKVRYGDRQVEVEGPVSLVQSGDLLVYAALPFVELQNQQTGYVTAHAAAVGFSSGAVMLFGKEGAGKTSTALGLCRWHGGKLIGNDLVQLGFDSVRQKVVARNGTKYFHLRYESMRRNLPDTLSLFPPIRTDPWLHKVFRMPDELGIEVQTTPVDIARSFLVHVDDTLQGLFVRPADGVVTRLYLNENFSRYIRATSIALFGAELEFLGYVPSLDTEELFGKRKILIEHLIRVPSMMYVSGPLKDVTDYIKGHIN